MLDKKIHTYGYKPHARPRELKKKQKKKEENGMKSRGNRLWGEKKGAKSEKMEVTIQFNSIIFIS